MNIKVQSQDEHSNHDHDGSQGSPLVDDDDAASDGITESSSLDDGDKKDGSSKKRKRRVRVNITYEHYLLLLLVNLARDIFT